MKIIGVTLTSHKSKKLKKTSMKLIAIGKIMGETKIMFKIRGIIQRLGPNIVKVTLKGIREHKTDIVAIAFKDRDLRNIDNRDNTEKEAGARVRVEIIDKTEIKTSISSLGLSHSDTEGNSHQLEERGATGKITIRIIKRTNDTMNPIEFPKNSKIREEAQIITKAPNIPIKIKVDIVDLDLDATVYQKGTIMLKAYLPRRALTPLNLRVLSLMEIAPMEVLIVNLMQVISNTKSGINLEISKFLGI